MTCKEKVTALHDAGHNCCQSVLEISSERFGMDGETAYRLGAFFGGGMRKGEVCGAATGALMALGLAYGDENNRSCRKSLEFFKAFEERFGSLLCKEIIGQDGLKKKEMCPLIIEFCAEYLEKEFEG